MHANNKNTCILNIKFSNVPCYACSHLPPHQSATGQFQCDHLPHRQQQEVNSHPEAKSFCGLLAVPKLHHIIIMNFKLACIELRTWSAPLLYIYTLLQSFISAPRKWAVLVWHFSRAAVRGDFSCIAKAVSMQSTITVFT